MPLPLPFKTLRITHHHLTRELDNLAPENFYTIPQGRDDNILWNVGHVTCSLARISYAFSGHPLPIPEHYLSLFGKDTNALAWNANPVHTEVLKHANKLLDQIEADYPTQKFANYKPWDVGGATIDTIEEAIAFHSFHEGLHIGKILDIKIALGLPVKSQ